MTDAILARREKGEEMIDELVHRLAALNHQHDPWIPQSPAPRPHRRPSRHPRPNSTRPGGGCNWRATPSARIRSITSSASSPISRRSTATASSATTPPSSAAWAVSKAARSCWSAEQKGRDTKQKLYRNFGMPKPEGYRKALRAMQLAAKFGRPIITFLDTPGAYPGIDAEERGQAEAIARNLREMARLRVPVIVVVIGEGGSGGALALGVGNRRLMLENAVYSVISPESCAAIIYRDSAQGRAGRRRPAAHRGRLADARADRRHRAGTARRRSGGLGRRPPPASKPRSASDWRNWLPSAREQLVAHRYEQVPAHGQLLRRSR